MDAVILTLHHTAEGNVVADGGVGLESSHHPSSAREAVSPSFAFGVA